MLQGPRESLVTGRPESKTYRNGRTAENAALNRCGITSSKFQKKAPKTLKLLDAELKLALGIGRSSP